MQVPQKHWLACRYCHAQLPDSRLPCVQGSVDPPATAALAKLLSLFGLSFIAREAGDFLEDGYLSGQQVRHSDVREGKLTRQCQKVCTGLACECVSYMDRMDARHGEDCLS